MRENAKAPKSVKAQITRASLVVAAAAILRAQGPSAVTYRRVAEWADASSSSVGYYFASINDLLEEAASYNISMWAQRAEKVANNCSALSTEECRKGIVGLLMRACLPEGITVPAAHYEQLITASESEIVTRAYRNGRVRLDAALEDILRCAKLSIPPVLITSVVDGASVKALSEGLDLRELVKEALEIVVSLYLEKTTF